LNDDAYPDLVVASRVTFDIRVFRGQPGGVFQPSLADTVPFAGSPAIVDVDGDADLDLVLAKSDSAVLILFRNNGDGEFADPESFSLPYIPRLALPAIRPEPGGDAIYVCGDDLSMSSLVYLGGLHTVVEPLDVTFSFDDLAQTIAAIGTTPGRFTDGDVTGDGFVGMDDVNVVVENIDESAPPNEIVWCDDNGFEEPECGGFNRRWDGVQECMRAAMCRATVCHWAACINLRSGAWIPWWIGQNLACAAVADAELLACVTAVIPGL